MSLVLTRTNAPRLAFKALGFGILLGLVALNIWLLRDAINFELPDHGGPACYYAQKYLGLHLAPVLYLAQLIPLVWVSIYMRSWFVFGFSVFPLWLIVYMAACGHN